LHLPARAVPAAVRAAVRGLPAEAADRVRRPARADRGGSARGPAPGQCRGAPGGWPPHPGQVRGSSSQTQGDDVSDYEREAEALQKAAEWDAHMAMDRADVKRRERR